MAQLSDLDPGCPVDLGIGDIERMNTGGLGWVDRELGVVGEVVRSSFAMSLSPLEFVKQDAEREARHRFENEWSPSPLPGQPGPRTSDPAWSPIVELEVVEHEGCCPDRWIP